MTLGAKKSGKEEQEDTRSSFDASVFRLFGRDKRIIRDVAELAKGSAIALLLKSLAAPVLTRLYTPEEFGYFAVFLSVCSVLAIVASGRYELGIVISREEEEASALTVVTVLMAFGFSCLCLIVVFIISGWGRGVGDVLPTKLLLFVPLGVLAFSLSNIIVNALNYAKAYRRIGFNRVLSAIGMLSLQIGGGFLPFINPLISLVGGRLFGGFTFVGYSTRDVIRRFWKYIRLVKRKDILYVLRKHKRFPQYTLPSAFVNKTKTELPEIMFLWLFDPAVAGFYALTKRVVDRPLSFIGSSVKDVFFRYYSEMYQDESAEGATLLRRAVLFLVAISLIPSVLFYLFPDQIVEFVFGAEWIEVVPYIQVLLPPIVLEFIAKATGMSMYVMEKQNIVLYWAVAALIGTVLSIYGGSMLGGAIVSIILFAILKGGMQLLYIGLNIYYAYAEK